ncbi:hypothetical protein CXG81DRAFT_7916, partial [Caulochytrium protostelioides]
DAVWQVSWHPTRCELVACGADKRLRLFSGATAPGAADARALAFTRRRAWKTVAVAPDAHRRTVRTVAYAPRGVGDSGALVASGGFDGLTAVWEIVPTDGAAGGDVEFECLATLEGHENEVKCVGWSATGAYIATCSRDKSIWIWEVTNESDFDCLAVLQEHTQDVKCIAWHPTDDTLLASASYDDTIKIWQGDELGDGDWFCIATLQGHTSTVWAIDFDPTGRYLASVSDDRSLRIWARTDAPVATAALGPGTSRYQPEPRWELLATFSDLHDGPIYSVAWSKTPAAASAAATTTSATTASTAPIEAIATCGGDNAIALLAVHRDADGAIPATGGVVLASRVDHAHGTRDANCVRWCPHTETPDHRLLASAGDDGRVRIWRL